MATAAAAGRGIGKLTWKGCRTRRGTPYMPLWHRDVNGGTTSTTMSYSKKVSTGRRLVAAAIFALAFGSAGCTSGREQPASGPKDTLVVYLAASLTRPLQPVLDTFAARTGAV